MADIATTTIQYGAPDGERIVIPEGEPVKGLPKDVVKELREQGHIGDSALTPEESDQIVAEKEALQARVRELEQELKDAKDGKPSGTPGAPSRGTGAPGPLGTSGNPKE